MNKHITLPDNHTRSLSVTASVVERTLNEMENLLRSKGVDALTSKTNVSYSDEQRRHMLKKVDEMRKANEELVRTFGLRRDEHREEQVIKAALSHLWVILVDSTAKGMRGFGHLAPELGREVDARIQKLLNILKDFQ
jgi:hypothetical protein